MSTVSMVDDHEWYNLRCVITVLKIYLQNCDKLQGYNLFLSTISIPRLSKLKKLNSADGKPRNRIRKNIVAEKGGKEVRCDCEHVQCGIYREKY